MRTRLIAGLGVVVVVGLSAQAACVGDDATSVASGADSGAPQGSEGGECFANGTCNTGLVCVIPNQCVKPGADSGADVASDSTTGTDAASDAADAGPPPPSCASAGDGRTNCGGGTESCCTSLTVTGGAFDRTYSNTGGVVSGRADPATVSTFRLDKYEVTVGRFRAFVAAWNGGSGGFKPTTGAGKHVHHNPGNGLAASDGGFETGWNDDASTILPTDLNLACDPSATWTPAAGANEKRPINCVTWQEAAAFCIWDGGFLPSEAEWEYAAAGGGEQREYPWGSTAPGTANAYAIYDCRYPSSSGSCDVGAANLAVVGTPASGAGKYGQLDLGGNVWEWNLDFYATPYLASWTDRAYTTPPAGRVIRGGSYVGALAGLSPTYRSSATASYRLANTGARCARTP